MQVLSQQHDFKVALLLLVGVLLFRRKTMLLSISEFDNYTGNFEDSVQTVDLKTTFLSSAQELVGEYLRFDPEERWDDNNVPDIVRLTILRIATLMLMEGGENIGVSSKSFADNSRTFISYTNYMKYLSPLQTYRDAKF